MRQLCQQMMGPKGSNINNITQTTGCYIEVPKERVPGQAIVLNIHTNAANGHGLGQAIQMVSQVFV